jgi:hypothetical protein|tara:strand:+ start:395 stop:1465 length:1071 start_codon:yes stop_codon:yes gene_type:complete
MAYTTIDDPSVYFQTTLYTGNATNSTAITNGGNSDLQPDWLWIKNRSSSGGVGPHFIVDSSRGANKDNHANNEEAEHTTTNAVKSFNSDGFTIDSGGTVNNNSDNYVAWQWKCNGGTTETAVNESGNNPAHQRQTNATAGFSIITSTGTGGAGTIQHGLGAIPHWIISKGRSNDGGWVVYHQSNTSAPETDALNLSSNGATVDAVAWFNDTAPTSSVFTVGTTNDINGDGRTYIHYVFTEIQGYSKFGSYAGNNSTDGPFVYTGFTPAWVMIKRTDGGTNNWPIWDYERGVYNGARAELYANLDNAEATDSAIDILSNGFKLRNASTEWNNGTNYIYMAFAKHPFVSSKGVPTTAV